MNKLTDYFISVDEDRARKSSGDIVLCTEIDGKTIRQHFESKEQADSVMLSFTGLLTSENTEPDAEFFYWTDSLDAFLPEKDSNANGVWVSRDDSGYLQIIGGYGMVGADHVRSRYYICLCPQAAKKGILYGHAMLVSLFRYFMVCGRLLLHSAAVGVGGTGVLIAARGGGGKSTLAASWLMKGHDFVSDDYTILTMSGPLKAMPLYRTIGLNTDMEAVLNTGLPVLRRDEERNGKLLLDASSCRFCPSLTVRGIILPKLTDRSDPCIESIPAGRALVPMIHSSLEQIGSIREPSLVKLMTDRLRGLPVFALHLTHDPWKNTEYLYRFIKENFKCTS